MGTLRSRIGVSGRYFPLTPALSPWERENRWLLFLDVTLCDEDGGMNIAVGTLGFGDDIDAVVDEVSEIWIVGSCQCGAGGLQPFVEVAVIERRAAMAASGEAGSNAEILEKLAVVGALHDAPERGDGFGAAGFEPIGPEAMGPADFVRIERLKAGRQGKQRGEGEHKDRNSKAEI